MGRSKNSKNIYDSSDKSMEDLKNADLRKFLKIMKPGQLIKCCAMRFMMAWLFVSILKIIYIRYTSGYTFNDINYVGVTESGTDIIINFAAFMLFNVIFECINMPHIEKKILFAGILIYSFICIVQYPDIYFVIGIIFLIAVSMYFCIIKKPQPAGVNDSSMSADKAALKGNNVRTDKAAIAVIAVAAAVYIIFTGAATGLRYICHIAPNFDLGLFSQMFHYMKENLTMNVTSERDRLLSHMCVHVSPAFYFILPAYMLFSSPLTLQIMQVLIIAAGIIPFVLICRVHGMKWKVTAAMSVCYFMYPALSGGCFYDIHENMFLPLFILLLIYSMEKNSTWGIFLSAVLVLSVKEDAAVYVAVIALYMIVGRRMYKKGAAVFAISLLYFICTSVFLTKAGDGVMTYRFYNMMFSHEQGFSGIIRTIISDPAFIITQMFKAGKMKYILQMFVPVMFIPLITNKLSRYILLIPLVLFNLMPDYAYQHNIFFQYSFGSGILLLYLCVLNISDFRQKIVKRTAVVLPVLSVLAFAYIMYPKTGIFTYYRQAYVQENIDVINSALALIPPNASVTATTFLCPALSDRDILYELAYTDKEAETEYTVLDLRYKTEKADINSYLNNEQYEQVFYKNGVIAIFKRK